MSASDRRTDAAVTETRRGGLRVLGWTLLALVLLVLAILAGAFGVLQTGWAKREIASLASAALSAEDEIKYRIMPRPDDMPISSKPYQYIVSRERV
jgi:hypothetical protein